MSRPAAAPVKPDDVAALRAAAAAEPDRAELRFRLARALYRGGQNAEALAIFTALDEAGAPAQWVFLRGLVHFALGQFNEADAAFARAFAAEPQQADWSAWRARALLAGGDLDAAGEALERAAALRPDKAAFALLLTRTCLRQDRVAEAQAVVSGTLAVMAGDDPLGERLRAMQPILRLAEARGHVLQGALELRATHWRRAIKALDKALALAPDQTPWRVLRGRALMGADELDAARDELAAAARADPRAGTFALLATVQQRQGDHAGALSSVERAVEADPEGPAWRAKLAGMQLAAGQADEAILAYRDALKATPSHAAWRFGLARALLKVGDLTGAREELAAVTGKPAAPPPWLYLLGTVQSKLGDQPAAMASWRRAIEGAGKAANPAWRARLAGVLAADGFELDALEELEKAVTGKAATPAIRAQLAQLYWRLAQAPEALAQIERALAEENEPPFKWTLMADEIRGRLAGGESRSRATSRQYADAFYRTSKAQAAPAEDSAYYGFWQVAAAAIRDGGAGRLLDIGCGPGQFAEFITGAVRGVSYTGVDFSGVAVELARARVPTARFEQRDLSSPEGLDGLDYDLVVALEVLEHIDDDLGVLSRLRPGARFVGSVPNFDSFGHVRFFKSDAEVNSRYAQALGELVITPFKLSPNAILFLMSGVVV